MNRLFITTALALTVALGLSAGASYWLAIYPPFQADAEAATDALQHAASELEQLLTPMQEHRWDLTVELYQNQHDYLINWYAIDEFSGSLDEHAALLNQQRIINYTMDGTPILEVLFPEQQLILEILPGEGLLLRDFLNIGATVLSVLLIGLAAAALALMPVAHRLRGLQRLANQYAAANWQAKNRDTASDPIGQLGQSMQDMAGKIESLVDDKSALLRDQQTLMRAVAHEFRAPMARMRFALEMDDHGEPATQNQQEVSRALDELNDLVSEVLRFARLQTSAPALELQALPAARLIEESIAKCRRLEHSKTITHTLPDTTVMVMADAAQYQRALDNLITNAIKYASREIAISCEINQRELSVHVDDDGSGIAAADRHRILTPFVRLDASRSRQLGGTGLGLAIANGVAQKHGGRLVVSDSPTGGARLSLTVLLAQPLHQSATEKTAATGQP